MIFKFPLINGELIFTRIYPGNVIEIKADGKKYNVTSEELEECINKLGLNKAEYK